MTKVNKDRYGKGAPPIAAKDYFNPLRTTRLQPPAIGIFDEPTRCYKINLEWASHIEGAIEVLAEWTAWLGEDDERNIAVQQIRELLKGSDCVDCNEVIDCLNQNPDWISFQSITVEHMAETTAEFFAELETQYDGNPNSINPAIPTDEPDLASEENALCHAIGAWVRLYCENKKVAIRQSSFLSQAWNALQNAIEGAYGLISNVTGFNLLDDLFACFVDNATALAALDDESAKSDIICCLYGELKDIALVENSLEGAINACLGTLAGTAHDLLCLMSNDLNLQHTLNFFYIYGRSLDRQTQGEVLECECETWQFSYLDFDFQYGSHGFAVVNGNYVDGQYFEAINLDPDPDLVDVRNMPINKDLGVDYRICGMGMVYDTSSDCGTPSLSVQCFNDGIGVGGGSLSPSGTNNMTHRTWSWSSSANGALADEIQARAGSHRCDGNPATTRIYRVRVWFSSNSPVKGIPSDIAPSGLSTNGSTDMTWWQ